MSVSLPESLCHAIVAIERVTTRTALVLSIGMLALAAVAAFYQVITRFVFNDPSHFSEVASRSLIIWSVFLGAANVFRRNEMMRVEIIFAVLPRRLHVVLEYFVALLCLLFFVLLAYYGYLMGLRVQPQRMAGMDISMAWAYSALPVGSAFAIIALIGRLLDSDIRQLRAEPVPAVAEGPDR
ncbi:TRAP transporter small permease [Spiribacter vilamensis]|uniref:TRAP transporter small permease protein n=1 Tax=Spiribacter vilamensis TaxID=531306 RepID=A0A4Q8CZ83_9GAMM|nr:TRAP transporter small permease [Spiribacter vilamensis]RZU98331.1 TRAP-type C4-dicarboxylate transport system permease small subunit [Spiribacter vilamensis]TVO60782.1 TRAP transporter small permease [Spiribacter vilamensis]